MYPILNRNPWAGAVAAVFALVLALGSVSTLQAQTPDGGVLQHAFPAPSPFTVGVKGGIATLDFNGRDTEAANAELGFSGGVFARYQMGRRLAIQPELLYTHRRSSVDHSAFLGTQQPVRYELGMIEVPLLFHAQLPERGGTFATVYTGPRLGYQLYGTADERLTSNRIDVEDRFRKAHYGWALGAGVETLGPVKMLFDARYTIGLHDMMKGDNPPAFKDQGFTLAIGVGF